MERYFVFFIIAVVIIFAISMMIYQHQKEKQRTVDLQKLAPQLGLTYESVEGGVPTAVVDLLQGSGSKRYRNVLRGRRDGCEFLVFDYSYTVHAGKSTHTVTQTVVAIDLVQSGIFLPKFILRSWRIGDNIKKEWFGYDFIDLPTKYNDHVLISFENKLDLQEMVDSVQPTVWQHVPYHSYWLSDGGWFICYINGQTIEAKLTSLEKSIVKTLQRGQQLSRGRVKDNNKTAMGM